MRSVTSSCPARRQLRKSGFSSIWSACPGSIRLKAPALRSNHSLTCAPVTRADIRVEAVLPSPAEAADLEIGAGAPCLLMKRRTWDGDRVVTVVFALHPGARFQLTGGAGDVPGAA